MFVDTCDVWDLDCLDYGARAKSEGTTRPKPASRELLLQRRVPTIKMETSLSSCMSCQLPTGHGFPAVYSKLLEFVLRFPMGDPKVVETTT